MALHSANVSFSPATPHFQSSPVSAMSSRKPADRGASRHWSDRETAALVQAWGQLYLQRNCLRDAEWREVCGAVNAHRAAAGRRFDRTVAGCQGRIYSLKSQYKKEVAKGQPTSGWRHFAQLRAFLGGPDNGPPPGFTTMTPPPASVKGEEMVEEVEVDEASGSVPAKRKFSGIEDILVRSGGPPPGFPARMPATAKKKKEMVEEVEVDEASGSVGRKTVPAKRKFSGLQDILDRSGGPPPGPGFPAKMPPTAKEEEVKEEEEEVVGEGPAHGAASAEEWLPGAVVTKLGAVVTNMVTKLSEVYCHWSVEMERLGVEKQKMEMEMMRAPKVEAENLGETEDK